LLTAVGTVVHVVGAENGAAFFQGDVGICPSAAVANTRLAITATIAVPRCSTFDGTVAKNGRFMRQVNGGVDRSPVMVLCGLHKSVHWWHGLSNMEEGEID
jgi:hypothetical protein